MKVEFELSKEELHIFRDTLLSKYHEIGWNLKLTEQTKSRFKNMKLQYHTLMLVLNQINTQLDTND